MTLLRREIDNLKRDLINRFTDLTCSGYKISGREASDGSMGDKLPVCIQIPA